jgi:hypothetical protein
MNAKDPPSEFAPQTVARQQKYMSYSGQSRRIGGVRSRTEAVVTMRTSRGSARRGSAHCAKSGRLGADLQHPSIGWEPFPTGKPAKGRIEAKATNQSRRAPEAPTTGVSAAPEGFFCHQNQVRYGWLIPGTVVRSVGSAGPIVLSLENGH